MAIFFTVPWRQSALLLLLAVPAAALTGLLHPLAPAWGEPALEPGQIRLETALGWGDVLWLDARSRAEFEEGHIPGALLLNEDEWEGLFFDFMAAWEPGQKVVVYCGGSLCQASEEVARRLRTSLEDDDIYVLRGGWNEWMREVAP